MEKYLNCEEAKALAGLALDYQDANPDHNVTIEKEKSKWNGEQKLTITIQDQNYKVLVNQQYVIVSNEMAINAMAELELKVKDAISEKEEQE